MRVFFNLNMSYFLAVANLLATTLILEFFYLKLNKLYKQKHIKEVLFSRGDSACCNDNNYTEINKCSNRYCMKKNVGRLIQLIDKSQHSICLAMYRMNYSEVQRALVRAHKRGVQIKILTTAGSMTDLSRDLLDLSIAGCAIGFPVNEDDKLLHHKFCLLDTIKEDGKKLNESSLPERGVLMTGSMNWTLSSICSNWDNIVITSDDIMIKSYQNEFNFMWNKLTT